MTTAERKRRMKVKYSIARQEAGYRLTEDGTTIQIHPGYILRVRIIRQRFTQFHSSVASAMKELRRLRKSQ